MTQVTGTVTATHLTYLTVNTVSNGDFETGDFTGWATQVSYVGNTATVTSNAKREGDYGVLLTATVGGYGGTYVALYKTVDLSGATGISFYYKVPEIYTDAGGHWLDVLINDSMFSFYSFTATTEWIYICEEIPVEVRTASASLKFMFHTALIG